MLRNLSKFIVPVLCVCVVITGVSKLIDYRFEQLAQDKFSSQYVTAAERDRQLTCLARNIYFESASEPFEGKVAVAQVTLNRAASGDFPADICGVVYEKNTFVRRTVCQFSWYCNSPSLLKVRSPAHYAESMEVAKKVLLEGFRLNSLNDALYYHADYVNPGWRKEKITQIGHHIFYKG